jgi:hypothetical protein
MVWSDYCYLLSGTVFYCLGPNPQSSRGEKWRMEKP